MTGNKSSSRSPWLWIPSLYFAEGLPYALAMSVSLVLYKNLGVSNEAAAFYTSWFYLPWVVKPLWSPVVDILKTRRLWIWAAQLLGGALLAGVALTVPTSHFFQWTLVFFWLLAFNSATHDIAADGFYMLATTEREQAFYSGIRNTFYRVAWIAAQGGLVILAGVLQGRTGSFPLAWSLVFALVAGVFLCLGLYHRFILPRPQSDTERRPLPRRESSDTRKLTGSETGVPLRDFFAEFFKTFGAFFRKPKIITLLLFLLLYRLGEAQLVKMAQLFLLDPRSAGGLALTDEQVGFIYNTIGVVTLLFGGLVGGFVVSRQGLKFWLWPMLLAIHLPDAVYIWLAYAQPIKLSVIGAGVAVEQFGYGFGFTAFMLYMIYIARGEHRTAHYAICTGFMALGMMVPGMWSGWLQQHIGYAHFFTWVILATIPSFIVALRVPLDAEFGKRGNGANR